MQFGDVNNAFSFMTGIVGYPGGQSFPFTAGSGYTNGNYVTGGVCALNTTAGTTPMAPAMGFNVSGGAIINAYPTQIGSSIFGTCSFPISFTFTGNVTAYGTGVNVGTTHATMAVTGITSGTGPGTIVPGEVLSGTNMTGGAIVVSGPFNGLNGSYTIDCGATSCSGSATVTSGPTSGSGGAIATPALITIDGIGGFRIHRFGQQYVRPLRQFRRERQSSRGQVQPAQRRPRSARPAGPTLRDAPRRASERVELYFK